MRQRVQLERLVQAVGPLRPAGATVLHVGARRAGVEPLAGRFVPPRLVQHARLELFRLWGGLPALQVLQRGWRAVLREGRRLRGVQGELQGRRRVDLREAGPPRLPCVHGHEPRAAHGGDPDLRARPLQGHGPRKIVDEARPAWVLGRRFGHVGLGGARVEVRQPDRRDEASRRQHRPPELPVERLLRAAEGGEGQVYRLEGRWQRLRGPHVRLVRADVLEVESRLDRAHRLLRPS
mmetsp:Transcript_113098/g.325115  ORF Transcript_113098/g.325115 Transcript_113098/m.325115 type:complete len:236 (+) Transcript_113098:1309-2016(+)